MNKIRVLFLCTGNSARSQMAEAFARHYGQDAIEAHSAGVDPKGLHPMTIKVMQETGIDMGSHTSKPLSLYLGKGHFTYMITVCGHADASCPSIFPGIGKRLHWDFEDPASATGSEEEQLDKFREIREQIRLKTLDWLQKLKVPVSK